MPSINMIAPRRAEKKRLEKNVRRLLMAILAEAVLIVGVSLLMLTGIYTTKAKAEKCSQDLQVLQPKVKLIENCDKETMVLKPKLETLDKAKTDTYRWCRVMDKLSSSLPDKTWLTRVATVMPQVGQESQAMAVSINGVAANQQLVGDAMLRMHDMVKDFDSIDLHFTQKTMIGFTPAVEFEVAAAIKVPKEENKREVQKS